MPDPGSSLVRRWDGKTKEATVWNSLDKDLELCSTEASCFVYFTDQSLPRDRAAIAVPFERLVVAKCQPLITKAEVHGTSQLPPRPSLGGSSSSHKPSCTLRLQAPSHYDADETNQYHITTRNFFAWVMDKPIVGPDPATALLALKLRMDIWRANGANNFADVYRYARAQGYGDLGDLQLFLTNHLKGSTMAPSEYKLVHLDAGTAASVMSTRTSRRITKSLRSGMLNLQTRMTQHRTSFLRGMPAVNTNSTSESTGADANGGYPLMKELELSLPNISTSSILAELSLTAENDKKDFHGMRSPDTLINAPASALPNIKPPSTGRTHSLTALSTRYDHNSSLKAEAGVDRTYSLQTLPQGIIDSFAQSLGRNSVAAEHLTHEHYQMQRFDPEQRKRTPFVSSRSSLQAQPPASKIQSPIEGPDKPELKSTILQRSANEKIAAITKQPQTAIQSLSSSTRPSRPRNKLHKPSSRPPSPIEEEGSVRKARLASQSTESSRRFSFSTLESQRHAGIGESYAPMLPQSPSDGSRRYSLPAHIMEANRPPPDDSPSETTASTSSCGHARLPSHQVIHCKTCGKRKLGKSIIGPASKQGGQSQTQVRPRQRSSTLESKKSQDTITERSYRTGAADSGRNIQQDNDAESLSRFPSLRGRDAPQTGVSRYTNMSAQLSMKLREAEDANGYSMNNMLQEDLDIRSGGGERRQRSAMPGRDSSIRSTVTQELYPASSTDSGTSMTETSTDAPTPTSPAYQESPFSYHRGLEDYDPVLDDGRKHSQVSTPSMRRVAPVRYRVPGAEPMASLNDLDLMDKLLQNISTVQRQTSRASKASSRYPNSYSTGQEPDVEPDQPTALPPSVKKDPQPKNVARKSLRTSLKMWHHNRSQSDPITTGQGRVLVLDSNGKFTMIASPVDYPIDAKSEKIADRVATPMCELA